MSLMYAVLEYLFQTLSQHHKDYPIFIQKHCGKRCQLRLGNWQTTLQVHYSGILFCHNIATDNLIFIPDVLSILHLSDTHLNIQFHGDISFCQDFARLLSSQKIDIDGLLFSILPDHMAVLSLEGLDILRSVFSHTRSQALTLLKDYLVHETGLCVDKKEANALYEKTQKLKWQLDTGI